MKTNKVTLITGATSGIGKATAEALSAKGHELIILARNADKAQDLISGLPGPAKFVECDFDKLESVEKAAGVILKETEHLDNLINNAGAIFPERMETSDGFEKHFGVNHLAPFLLTQKLMPLILKSDSKVINVSSDAYKQAKVDFSDLQLEKSFSPIVGYANSKLYNILFTKELAERYREHGLQTYALHPGVINSNFGDSFSGFIGLLMKVMKPFMKGIEEGAATSVMLAEAEKDHFTSGSYFKNRKPAQTKDNLVNSDFSKHIWEVSERMTTSYM